MAKHGWYRSPDPMDGIPHVAEHDAEDVAWALRTADALWKRHEYPDALVWLRRAAQAAVAAADDERALSLARAAAELVEIIVRLPASDVQTVVPASSPPPSWHDDGSQVRASAFDDDEMPTLRGSGRVLATAPVLDTTPAPQFDPWAEAGARSAVLTSEVGPPPREQDHLQAPPPPDSTFDVDEVVTSAPPLLALQSEGRLAAASRVTLPDMDVDLNATPEFADLPDDARSSFARAAVVRSLSKDDDLSEFAVALVLSGAVGVVPAAMSVPVTRLTAGSVLRSRGTLPATVGVRLACLSDRAIVATWSDSAVEEAFCTCPWVEDELRAGADKVYALVGAATGPFATALDASLRAEIVKRMSVRTLLAGEAIVDEGVVVPGFLVVGLGDLELDREGAFERGLRSGGLLFASESLGDRPSPFRVRAGAGGALVLFADRSMLKAMVARWPPLLEAFARV